MVRMANSYAGGGVGSVYFSVPLMGPRVRTLVGVQFVRNDIVDQIPFLGAGAQTALLGLVWAQAVPQNSSELRDAPLVDFGNERGVGSLLGDLVTPQQITVSGDAVMAAKYVEVESLHDAIHGRLQISAVGALPGRWVLQVIHSPVDSLDDNDWNALVARMRSPRLVGPVLDINV
jgi:hypothetical protein